MNEVYYRILYINDEFKVCCLQVFDERDYPKEKKLPLKFDDENKAILLAQVLNNSDDIEFAELNE